MKKNMKINMLRNMKNTMHLQSGLNFWWLLELFKWQHILSLSSGIVFIFTLQGDTNEVNVSQEQLADLSNQFERLYNSLRSLIERFNNTISDNNINSIMIEGGNLGIDLETELSDELVQRLTNMLDIIRTSIIQRESQIDELLDSIWDLDENLYNTLYNDYVLLKQTFRYH